MWRVRLLVAWGWQGGDCWVFVTFCTVAGVGEHPVKTKQKKVLGLAEWLRKAAVKIHFFLDVLAPPVWLGIVYWALSFYLLMGLLCSAFPPVSNRAKNGLFVSFWGYNCLVHDLLWLFSSQTTHRHVKYQRDTELLSCSQVPLAAEQGLSLEEKKLSGEDPNGILVVSPAISCVCGVV